MERPDDGGPDCVRRARPRPDSVSAKRAHASLDLLEKYFGCPSADAVPGDSHPIDLVNTLRQMITESPPGRRTPHPPP